MTTQKAIRRRKARKPTGKWKELVFELRKRIEGVDADGKPILSQADFGKILQVAGITASRWETGAQDPPGSALARLAIVACNTGSYDLEVAFQTGRAGEDAISGKDKVIISLLASLFRWRAMTKAQAEKPGLHAEIHAAAKTIFDLAARIVGAQLPEAEEDQPARKFLIADMARLLRQVFDAEHTFPAPIARVFGAPMYTVDEPLTGDSAGKPEGSEK